MLSCGFPVAAATSFCLAMTAALPAPVLGSEEQPGPKIPAEVVEVTEGVGDGEPVCAWAAGARPPMPSGMATAAAATAAVKPERDNAMESNLQQQAEAGSESSL